MRRLALLLFAVAALVLAACGGDDGAEPAASSVAGFEITGGGVEAGGTIATRFTCDGDNISPELRWTGVPEGTRELALLLDDPEADGFTHWLVYGMRPSATRLPPRVQPLPQISGPTPLLQGSNDRGDVGYTGPCPPGGGAHTYVFHLLALGAEVGLQPEADRGAFDDAVEGHVIAEARLQASYSRE